MKLHTPIILAAALLGLPALAAADHPSRHAMEKVAYLAHEISDGAHHLYEKSSRYANHGYESERAIYALHELAEEARDFHNTVERYRRDPYRTEVEFREMIHAYYNAVDGFHYLPAYSHYRRDFRCLTDLMDDLVAYYGGYGSYRREPHGYYDRGRDGYRDGGSYRGNGRYRDHGVYKPGYRPGAYDRDGARTGRILFYIANEIVHEINKR